MKTKLKNLFFLLKKYNFVEVGLVRHLSDNFIDTKYKIWQEF